MDEIDREWADWQLEEDELDIPDDEQFDEDEFDDGGAGVLSPLDPDDPRNEGGAAVKLDRDLVLV